MNAERLAQLDTLTLKHGSHESAQAGMCAMEAVSWLAGEPHSDAPRCACPVITRAVIQLNDRIGNEATRTELLRPLLPKIIGTRAGRDVMIARGFVAADMSVRVFAPLALEARGQLDLAKSLRELRPVVDRETALEAEKAAYAAATYADTADAAARAAYAAYAADTVGAAVYAAYAAARRKVYAEGVRMIERMIEVGGSTNQAEPEEKR